MRMRRAKSANSEASLLKLLCAKLASSWNSPQRQIRFGGRPIRFSAEELRDEGFLRSPNSHAPPLEWILIFQSHRSQTHRRRLARTILRGAIHRVTDDGQSSVRQ